MIDLDKLNRMLDDALASETAESLNLWMEEQIEADRAAGIIRNADFGVLNIGLNSGGLTEVQEASIASGIQEYVSYFSCENVSGDFEINSEDNYNLAA